MLAICFEKKKEKCKFLVSLCEEHKFIAVATYCFTSTRVLNKLRIRCYELGSKLKVVKNTLVKVSLESTKFKSLCVDLNGATLFIFSSINIAETLNAVKKFVNFRFFYFEDRIFTNEYTKFFLNIPTRVGLCIRFYFTLVNLLRKFLHTLQEVRGALV